MQYKDMRTICANLKKASVTGHTRLDGSVSLRDKKTLAPISWVEYSKRLKCAEQLSVGKK